MLLYHGTSFKYFEQIIKRGITPRKTRRSQWEHSVPSGNDRVYLTECYAGYFAYSAAGHDACWLTIEVDVDKLNPQLLRPDEDFIGQAAWANKDAWLIEDTIRVNEFDSLEEITAFIRDHIDWWSDKWQTSLEYLGNISYKGIIPLSAITRIAVFDPESNPYIVGTAADPTITIMNHRFCSDKYKAITHWLMGEKVGIEEIELGYEQIKGMIDFTPTIEALKKQSIEIIIPENSPQK